MNILLIKYGYFVLFFGVAIEGEAFLLAAAFLAHQGYFHLWLVILVAVVSNCAADQVYYLIARNRGRQWLDRRFAQNPHYPGTITLMSRHSDWLLLVSRFAFGFRIIIPATCGVLRMPPMRFSLINLIAGTIWAVPVGLLGFYFGSAADHVLGGTKSYELWILLIALAGGAAVLLFRHLRGMGWIEDLKWSDLHLLVPSLIWLMGAINLISAIWPRSHAAMKALETWLPLEVTQRSRPPMMFAGLALMQVTRGLARRKELSWFVAAIALSLSIALHITRAFDLHHSLIAGLLLAYLIYFRRRYFAASDPASLKWALLMGPILFGLVFIYGIIGLTHLQGQYSWDSGNTPAEEVFNSGILIREPLLDPNTPRAARFLGSVQIAGWLARLYLLVLLLRPVILRSHQEVPDEVVQRIFKSYGRYSLSSFAIQSDKHHLLVANGLGLVAYATRGSVALACGDPVAPDSLLHKCIEEYAVFCQRNGWTPCVYEAAEARLPLYQDVGYRTLKIAEEALIDLNQFSLSGGKMSNLRAMVNKAAKAGMVVTRYHRQQEMNPQIDEQLEEISQEWLSEKHLGEMGFTMGRFTLESLVGVRVFIASVNERVEAFCSWLPFQAGHAAVLDLMRKRKDAPAGTMDILLAHSLLQLKDDKLSEASLANAPLANTSAPHGQLERGVALLFEKMNFLYGYKNLFKFKKKFAPRWEGRYLVYPKGTDIPAIAYALTGVHASGACCNY